MRQTYPIFSLQAILDQYEGFGNILESELFTSGFENSNFLLRTERGPVVLKIFEGEGVDRETILFEIEVMDASARAGVRSPQVFRTRSGKLHAECGDKVAVLMEFLPGENMAEREISDDIARELGAETGKMDAALAEFTDGSRTRQHYAFDLKNFLELEPKVDELCECYDPRVFAGLFGMFRTIKPSFDRLPSGLIHNDVVLHNILAKDGRLTGIIDFSDLAWSPYVQNIAVAFAQCFFTYNWQPKQAGMFLKEYRRFHPLSHEEASLLRTLTAARFGLLILEFNHWNVVFGDDDQRSRFILDNYRFLQRFLAMSEEEFEGHIRG